MFEHVIPEGSLLRSKRFWSAAIGLVVMIVSSLVPPLEQHLNVIAPTVIGLIGLLIGGYTAEDVALARAAQTTVAVSTSPVMVTDVSKSVEVGASG